jgi:RNA polymerase sigma-70 factor (ECF subfamily)
MTKIIFFSLGVKLFMSDSNRDNLLIEQCLQGQQSSFSELIDKYKNLVFNLAYRMTYNLEDAEDISQETFIRVYRSLYNFNPNYKFSTWLYQMTLNICRDRFRKGKIPSISLDAPLKEDDQKDFSSIIPNNQNNPEDIIMGVEQNNFINDLITSLPLKYREVIILRHLRDLSYEEMSKILNISLGSVKTRLFRAREKLREILETSR